MDKELAKLRKKLGEGKATLQKLMELADESTGHAFVTFNLETVRIRFLTPLEHYYHIVLPP